VLTTDYQVGRLPDRATAGRRFGPFDHASVGEMPDIGDRYQILHVIGSGATADVYLAEDLRYRRKVAVKRLKLVHRDGPMARGLEREVEFLSRLNHPHIVPMIDAGTHDDRPYLVMPHCQDGTLAERLAREGQLPIEDACRTVADLADALDCTHRHGVAHLDVKPSNILVVDGHAVLADFGVAKAIDCLPQGRTCTRSAGTPEYMSPEQFVAGARVDGRSDVYALGCLLFELLTGQPPFTGSSAQAIFARHLHHEIPSARVVRPTAPDALDKILRRALAKLPADRFQTAAQFGRSLRSTSMRQGRDLPMWRWFWAFAAGALAVAGGVLL